MSEQMGWLRLTSSEIADIRFRTNLVRISKGLNIRELEGTVAGHLLIDQRRARVSTLGILTGYARKTVRTTLTDMETKRLVDHIEDEGWSLTLTGRSFYIRVYRETTLIALGKQSGISEGLRRMFEELPSEGVTRLYRYDEVGRL